MFAKYRVFIQARFFSKYLTKRHITSTSFFSTHQKFQNEENPRNSRRWTYLVALAGAAFTYNFFKHTQFFPTVKAATGFEGLSGRRKQYSFIADVVDKSSPAVVYIEIKDNRRLDFFTGKPMTVSNGSGFIIKEDGLILTNAHVVASRPYSKVEVRLQNGKIYNGVVEDVDMQSDLATVRISAHGLPIIKLGNSSDLRPGEFVVAIGSPLSLSNSVSAGVVSSANRGADELGLRGKDMIYIQTDAAITFGNSGGPLVNLDGEAVGINSMKVTAGISFAIPIDYVKQFLANTKGQRPVAGGPKKKYMGITMLTLTPQIVNELQQRSEKVSSQQRGVLVWKVIIGSPAHTGGLQPGDIVTHINGQPIQGANDVYGMLSQDAVRDLKMSVIRQGRTVEVVVSPEIIN